MSSPGPAAVYAYAMNGHELSPFVDASYEKHLVALADVMEVHPRASWESNAMAWTESDVDYAVQALASQVGDLDEACNIAVRALGRDGPQLVARFRNRLTAVDRWTNSRRVDHAQKLVNSGEHPEDVDDLPHPDELPVRQPRHGEPAKRVRAIGGDFVFDSDGSRFEPKPRA